LNVGHARHLIHITDEDFVQLQMSLTGRVPGVLNTPFGCVIGRIILNALETLIRLLRSSTNIMTLSGWKAEDAILT